MVDVDVDDVDVASSLHVQWPDRIADAILRSGPWYPGVSMVHTRCVLSARSVQVRLPFQSARRVCTFALWLMDVAGA